MDVTAFGRDDTADVRDFAELVVATYRPYTGPPPVPERVARTAGMTRPGMTQQNWLARENGTVLGHAALTCGEQDNQHLAIGFIQVHPAHRRRGAGRELEAFLAEESRKRGRSVLIAGTHDRLDGGDATVDGVGSRFAEAVGYTASQTSLKSRLDLSEVDDVEYRALAERSWRHAGGYDVFTWVEGAEGPEDGGWPEELAEDLAYLEYRLTADMPHGDTEYEPERPGADRMRRRVEMLHATGTTLVHAAARHVDSGKTVAWTFIQPSPDAEDYAIQMITVVDPEHRGHRLGTLVKIANLRRMRELRPGLRYLATSNAEDNAPMIAVNEAMGYRPAYLDMTYQKRI